MMRFDETILRMGIAYSMKIDYNDIKTLDRALFFLNNRIENAIIDYTLVNNGFQPHVSPDLNPSAIDIFAFATGSRDLAGRIAASPETHQIAMAAKLYEFWYSADEYESYLPDNENTRSREHREYSIDEYTELCRRYIYDQDWDIHIDAILSGIPAEDVMA